MSAFLSAGTGLPRQDTCANGSDAEVLVWFASGVGKEMERKRRMGYWGCYKSMALSFNLWKIIKIKPWPIAAKICAKFKIWSVAFRTVLLICGKEPNSQTSLSSWCHCLARCVATPTLQSGQTAQLTKCTVANADWHGMPSRSEDGCLHPGACFVCTQPMREIMVDCRPSAWGSLHSWGWWY